MRFRNIRKHNNKSAIAAAKATRRGSPKTNYFSETTIFGTSLNLVLTKVVWLPPIGGASIACSRAAARYDQNKSKLPYLQDSLN